MIRKLFLLSIFTLLFSCGTPYPAAVTSSPDSKDFNVLNAESEKEIGESIIENKSGYFYKSIRLINEVKPVTYSANFNFPVGGIYELKRSSEEYDYYYSVATGVNRGIAIPKNGGKAKYFYDSGYGLKIGELNSEPVYENITTPDGTKDNFSKQLIYNGKAGNSIKFTYREFVNDLARPSFTQELQYDLSESNIIGFKGMRIEVINANNTNIRYKVIKGFE